MSDQMPEKNDALAQVLNRINVLMKHGDTPPAAPDIDESIPLLTDIYNGPPLVFTAQTPQQISVVEPASSETITGDNIPGDLIDSLLMEMMPMIQNTVKETVQLELVKLEKVLLSRLESELLLALRERLREVEQG